MNTLNRSPSGVMKGRTNTGRKICLKLGVAALVAGVTALTGVSGLPPAMAGEASFAAATAYALLFTVDAGLGSATAPALPAPIAPPPIPVLRAADVGYLHGSGEVTPVGGYEYSLPLEVPEGRAGMAPTLALRYSGGGNGMAGVGWSVLGLSSIARCASTPVVNGSREGVVFTAVPELFQTPDALCLDGQPLMLVSGSNLLAGSEYRTEQDGYSKIVLEMADALGPQRFRVWSKDGRVRVYTARQATQHSRYLFDVLPGTMVGSVSAMWLLDTASDRSGNSISYVYRSLLDPITDGTEYLIDHIDYTQNGRALGLRKVQFVYELRPDPSFGWVSGVRFNHTQRLKRLDMWAPNPTNAQVVWHYDLSYGAGSTGTSRSLLRSVKRCGALGGCLWSKNFDWYETATPTFTRQDAGVAYAPDASWKGSGVLQSSKARGMKVADFNGDGADDVLYQATWLYEDSSFQTTEFDRDYVHFGSNLRAGFQNVLGTPTRVPDLVNYEVSSPFTSTAFADHDHIRPIDLEGDGKAELLITHKNHNVGGICNYVVGWDNALAAFVNTLGLDVQCGEHSDGTTVKPVAELVNFGDMDGDGRLDAVLSHHFAHGRNNYLRTVVRYREGSQFAAPIDTDLPVDCAPQVVDLDGNGRADVVAATQTAPLGPCTSAGRVLRQTDLGVLAVSSAAVTADEADARRTFPTTGLVGDFNGDGLQDRLDTVPPTFKQWAQILWNSGNGFYGPSPVQNPATLLAVGEVDELPVEIRLADLNGDDRSDLVVVHTKHSPNMPGQTWITLLLSNTNNSPTIQGSYTAVEVPGTLSTLVDVDAGTLQLGDFNGDGRQDIAFIRGGHLYQLIQNEGYADLLKSVRDEPTTWARETVTYSNYWADDLASYVVGGCTYPLRCMNRGMPVVRNVASRAHWANKLCVGAPCLPYTVYYRYKDPVTDVRGRGFLGFGQTLTWDPQQPAQTITTYDQRTPMVDAAGNNRYYPGAHRPKQVIRAVPILTEAEAATKPEVATARVSRTQWTYQLKSTPNGKTYTVQTTDTASKTWEEPVTLLWDADQPIQDINEASAGLVSSSTHTDYDGYGNVVTYFAQTAGGTSSITTMQYENRVADWLLGLPLNRLVTTTAADGTFASRWMDYTHDALGRLATVEVEKPSLDGSVKSMRTFDYDVYGLTVQVTELAPGVAPRMTRFEYGQSYPNAPPEHIYRTQTWVPRANGLYQPSTWVVTHPGLGLPVASMNVNGVQANLQYDDLGRPVQVQADGQAAVAMSYAARVEFTGAINGIVVSASRAGATAVIESDALGRSLKSKVTGFDGTQILSDRTFNLQGQVREQSRPYTTGVAATYTHFEYDSLGRPLVTTYPDGTSEQWLQSFFETDHWDAEGSEQHTVRNVDGQLTQSTQLLGGVPLTTSYTYYPMGELRNVTDPKGNVNSMGYDVLGRRTQVVTPDAGTSTTTYNGLGEMLTSSRASINEVVHQVYDDLGRVKTVTGPEGAATTYTYDTQPHGIGALATAQSADGILNTYTYDDLSRPATMTVEEIATGDIYAVAMGYDNLSRIARLDYPEAVGRNRFALQYSYNGFGELSELGDATPGQPYAPLWKAQQRSLTQVTSLLGNGLVTATATLDPLTGRLSQMQATTAAGPVLGLSYDYYRDGLVKDRNDSVAQRQEAFTYDDLKRLKSWGLTAAGSITTTGYGYDVLGNLLQVDRNGTLVEKNTYGTANGSMPHALTSQFTGGAVSNSYGYDLVGRQTDGAGRTLDYNRYDLPKKVTIAATPWIFAYDAGGQRAKKMGVDEVTFYVAGLYEKRTTANTTVHVFHVPGPDGPVAQVTYTKGETTSPVKFLLSDSLGSTAVSVDLLGNVKERQFFEPFGGRILPNGNPLSYAPGLTANREGFTGHEHDDLLGLINMKGRMYDPKLKRFLTPDPIVSLPRFGQSWNPYSYVMNSPLNLTDPTGYKPGDDGVEGEGSSGTDGFGHGDGRIDIQFGDDPLTGYDNQSTDPDQGGENYTNDSSTVYEEPTGGPRVGPEPPKSDGDGFAPDGYAPGERARIIANGGSFNEDGSFAGYGRNTMPIGTDDLLNRAIPGLGKANKFAKLVDQGLKGKINLGWALKLVGAALDLKESVDDALDPPESPPSDPAPGGLGVAPRQPGKGGSPSPSFGDIVGSLKGDRPAAQKAHELGKQLTEYERNTPTWHATRSVTPDGDFLYTGGTRAIVIRASNGDAFIGPATAVGLDGRVDFKNGGLNRIE